MDLGLIVPLALLTGVLLRRHALGYLLAAVVLTKCAVMGLALVARSSANWWPGWRCPPSRR